MKTKQILIIIIIVILVIISDIIIENFTKKICNSMNEKLDEIDELLANDEFPKDKIEELVNEWKNKEKIISCYLEHEEIDKIGVKISLLESQVELENTDDARQSIAEMQFLFGHIANRQSLNFENFF